jgi:hypothetical protein
LGGRDDAAVLDERRGTVVIKCGKTQDAHSVTGPTQNIV